MKFIHAALFIIIFMIVYMFIRLVCIFAFGLTIGGAGAGLLDLMRQGAGVGKAQQDAASLAAAKIVNDFAINNQSVIVAFSSLISLLIFMKIYSIRKLNFFSTMRLDAAPSGMDVRYALFAGLSSNYIASIVLTLIYSTGLFKDALDSYQELMQASMGNEGTFRLLLGLGLIVPVVEEIMFRGMVSYELKNALPLSAVIIVQGVLFGMYHMNLVQMCYTIPLGVYFGYIAYKAGSLWPAIAAHMAMNVASVFNNIEAVEKLIYMSDFSWVFIAIFIIMCVSSLRYFIKKEPGANAPAG